MRETPREHQIYRHFKGNLYQIVTIAKHSETGEEMVIYRPMYGDGNSWVRPLPMFLSEVDHEKYPEVTQKYRFTLMNGDTAVEEPDCQEDMAQKSTSAAKESDASIAQHDKEAAQPIIEADQVAFEGGLDPLLEQFLDAGSYQEKLDIFYLMKRRGTMDMLRYVAISLDIEVVADDFDEMYRQILNCLKTMEKFECNRLRN